MFEDGIGGHGRAVRDPGHSRAGIAGVLEKNLHGIEHGLLEVRRRGRELVRPDAAGIVERNDVGKRAANVSGEADVAVGLHYSGKSNIRREL